MKTWEKIMLYPIGLYIWLTDGIMKMSKKWKPAMAMLMAVVMLCGMLPATAIADTNDDEADLLERLGVEGEVQLAELDGGKYIAVYLDDDDSRDSYNNQAAYYAIYDGIWQRPYILEDDGTKDYMPTISDLGNGQLFIAWGTASKTFDANTKEYAALNATDIVGVFVDKATGNISEVLEVTYETEDDVYGDENPRAAYDEATGRLMIWYNKCEYSDEIDPYFVLSYRLYDMRVKEFLDMGDSPDGDWYGQVLVGVDPAVTVEETLDASGYWAETPEFTEFYGWGCAVEFDAIQFNGQSLLAYVIDYDLNRSTTDDRDVYVLAYNFDDNSIIHPIMITNTDAGESNVEFRDVDGKLCLSYLSDGQEITFNISDNFSNANVLREGVTDDGVFYYYINKSADSGYIPATVAAKHTVSFAANEGSGSMTPVEVEDGTEYTLPACTFTAPYNKAFKAWEVNGEEKYDGETITVTEDTTIKAIWMDKSLGVKVGNVKVTTDNAANITGDGIVSGTVSYDYKTRTLTLNNATIYASTSSNAIRSNADLTIKLIGENTLYGEKFNGEASESWQWVISIEEEGNLDIIGAGSLTVNGAAGASHSSYSIYLYNGDLTVGGDCTVILNPSSSNRPRPLSANSITIIADDSAIFVSKSLNDEPLEAYDPDDYYDIKYMKFVPKYDVEIGFDANGGSGTMNAAEAAAATEYTLPENGFTAPAGKQFKNWEVNGTAMNPGDKVFLIEDFTVKAIWEDIPHTCSIEPVDKVWPDCENGGKEAYYKCEGCGKFFEDANGTTEIANIETWGNLPKNGHTEGTAWEKDTTHHWHICTVAGCGAVIESSKAAHTSTGDNVATCQKKAVCDVCGVTYGDFADHDWNTSWEKDETGHWYKCNTAECAEKKDFAAHTSTGDNVATCQKKAVCDDCGATYGDFAGHDWNTASWEKDETGHWYKCNTAECAEKKDFAAHTPDYQGGATEEYAVKCAECLYEIEAQLNHTHVFDKQVADEQYKVSGATCTEPAKYYLSCACGEKGADTFENGAANGHTAGTEWKSDADNHWHICTVAGCGAAVDSSAHTPDRAAATETDPVKCSVCGYEIAPALGHTHAYGAAWKSDADNHWNECACGDKANTAAHKDENADGKCDVCEYEVGTPGGSDDDDQPAGNPQTGDNNMLWIWLGLLCVSAMGIFAVTVFSKKKSVR